MEAYSAHQLYTDTQGERIN